MAAVNVNDPVTFKARSVTTLVGKITDQVMDKIVDKPNRVRAKISVFPNPASDKISITVENTVARRVELYDITAEKVGYVVFDSDSLSSMSAILLRILHFIRAAW